MPPGLPVLREIAEGALELDQQKRANVGALAGSNDDPRVQREVIELAVILDELRAATAPSVPAPSLRPANTSPKADRWADSTLLALLPAGDWYIERVDDVPKAAELVIGTRTGDLRTRKRAVKTAAEALRAQGVRVRARASGDSLAVYSPSQTRPAQLAKQAETATSRAEARRARKADKEAAKQAAAAKRRETAELKRSQAAAKRLARQKTPPRIFARPVGIDAVTGERVPLGTPGSSPSRGLYYVARPARGEPLTYVPVPAVDLAPTHTRHAIKRSRSDHYRALAHQAPISLPALPRDAAPPDGSDPAELARHQRSRELWALADQIDRATPNAPADARAILRRRSRSLRRWAEHPELVPPTSCSTGEDGCAFAAIARDVAKLTADPSSYSLTHAPTAEPEGLLTMPGAVAGDSALVAVPSARSAPSLIPARYVAVDAETLIPSHNPEGFDPRPDYPDNTQERRYERDPAEKLKVTTIAQQLVPELLANTNAGATDGTPIVTPSGVVLSGNGRTMGLQLHYRGGRTKMAEWLRDHAAQFGLDPAQLASIPRPIVVRVIDPSETAGGLSRLVRDFNVSLTQALAEDDETQAQARQLPPELPQILADGDAGDGLLPYLAHPRSKPLVAALERSGWITRSTRNRQLDPSGVLSLPARKAVAALITASVATDAALASPVLKKALDRSAVYWLIAAASGPTWDMRVPLSRATADYLAMKHDGACLLQWQQQQTLGTSRSSEGDPAAELLLEILDLAAARPVVFAKIAEAFARAAAEARGGGGLFGPPSTDPLTALQDAALSAGVKPASALSRRRCRKK